MISLEILKQEIEKERSILNELLITKGMSEVIEQSQKLDRMIEQYLDMAN
ncbi:aspartyl-phosphate phosphatase Spo0E family protein [Jingyaoa shaoxingensis]|uniref:Aspartyl-phosphate phosphatase Spo0E family protein n=1 Tax=Jingyaoa shaoxingensis TaxID=2763671 RepID=A0ABR7N5L9_9FIRM|nr:aspartyl-phosphate phosphatase Spo0E family protein [Jingyaoa shaoxingensis]MBC8571697.1 aspartyl-phosphate phosphatase Spo0E family protein [Jingyaoa shaoxingensis]